MQHAKLLVRNSLQHELAINYWGESRSAPDTENLHLLREAYVGMMELAVERARRGSRPELIQLLQFAVIKYLLQLVGNEFERLRSGLQQARGMTGEQSGGRSVELHERMVLLPCVNGAIRVRCSAFWSWR